jgi:carboxyl-terminal processing protease
MQQFYRPRGESTQKRGVLADVVMPSLTTHMDVGESDLDYPIDFDEVKAARFQANDMVNAEILRQLRANSLERRKSDEEFAKLERRIEQYRRQKDRKFVTLNEQKFLKERAELDAEKEDEKKLKEQISGDRPVFKRNFYNNEVLQIAVDYARLLTETDSQVAGIAAEKAGAAERTP